MDLFKGSWIMCTHWENAFKEFFKKKESGDTNVYLSKMFRMFR